MAKQSYFVHMKNKFPSASLSVGEDSVIASRDGEILCAVEKDGQGHWRCAKEQYGAKYPFSLDPLPKEARYWKLFKDGKVGPAEEHDSRKPFAKQLEAEYGRVPSQAELDEYKKAQAQAPAQK